MMITNEDAIKIMEFLDRISPSTFMAQLDALWLKGDISSEERNDIHELDIYVALDMAIKALGGEEQ